MEKIKGRVEFMSEKTFGIRINNVWYNPVGDAKKKITPDIKDRNVEFEADEKQRFEEIEIFDKVEVPKPNYVNKTQDVVAEGKKPQDAGYWNDKDMRITRMACLNSSLEAIKLSAGSGGFVGADEKAGELTPEKVICKAQKMAQSLIDWVYGKEEVVG